MDVQDVWFVLVPANSVAASVAKTNEKRPNGVARRQSRVRCGPKSRQARAAAESAAPERIRMRTRRLVITAEFPLVCHYRGNREITENF